MPRKPGDDGDDQAGRLFIKIETVVKPMKINLIPDSYQLELTGSI
jgi:hypothetical protein